MKGWGWGRVSRHSGKGRRYVTRGEWERVLKRVREWFGFWFLVGPPEATAKPKGGRRKIAAPNRPQGGLLGPARVGRSGQRVTAQPAPPGAVTGRKSFVWGGGGGGGSALVWWWCDSLGGGGGQRGDVHGRSVAPRRGAVRGCYTGAQHGTVLGATAAQGRSVGLRRGAARD